MNGRHRWGHGIVSHESGRTIRKKIAKVAVGNSTLAERLRGGPAGAVGLVPWRHLRAKPGRALDGRLRIGRLRRLVSRGGGGQVASRGGRLVVFGDWRKTRDGRHGIAGRSVEQGVLDGGREPGGIGR